MFAALEGRAKLIIVSALKSDCSATRSGRAFLQKPGGGSFQEILSIRVLFLHIFILDDSQNINLLRAIMIRVITMSCLTPIKR